MFGVEGGEEDAGFEFMGERILHGGEEGAVLVVRGFGIGVRLGRGNGSGGIGSGGRERGLRDVAEGGVDVDDCGGDVGVLGKTKDESESYSIVCTAEKRKEDVMATVNDGSSRYAGGTSQAQGGSYPFQRGLFFSRQRSETVVDEYSSIAWRVREETRHEMILRTAGE